MINFEDIIDCLALKGVKSLHIEMHDSMLKNMERESINEQFDALAEQRRGEHPVLVDGKLVTGRFLTDEEVAKLKNTNSVSIPSVCLCSGKHDQVVHRGDPGAGEPVVVPTLARAVTDPIVEKKTKLPVAIKVVEPKPTPVPDKPVDPVVEKKADPEPVKKAASETHAKPPYEVFCDMISSDDGKVTAEERVALINLMGLDDLLRVNNDFLLGLDTDKPVDAIRADVIECFS